MEFSETEAGHGGGTKGWIEFDSRTKKGMKQFGKLLKGVGKVANPAMMAASAFGEIGQKLGVMDAVMQGLSPLFDIVNTLLQVLSSSIMQALMPAIQPLIDLMPSLIPLIQQIGEFIGRTIAIGLEPLIRIIEMFLPIIEPILPIILQLLELGLIPLQVIFEVLFDIIEPLLPYIEDLAEMFEELSPAIDIIATVIGTLIKWSLIPLVGAIYGVGLVIAALIDAFTLGTAKAMSGWNEIMLPVLEGLAGGGGSGGGGSSTSDTPLILKGEQYASYQSGTEMVIKSGMMQVEAGEAIKRADLPGRQEELLEEILVINQRQIAEKRRSDFFNRTGRRR